MGIGVAELLYRDRDKLAVKGIDALDGTPLFDIKPHSEGSDCIKE
jgi:tRNA (Thr-GGU) A37 N-methylase